MKFKVSSSSEEYASADVMVLDEAGIDLQIDGITELGGSFENLDRFELAFAVLPEDIDVDTEEDEEVLAHERAMAAKVSEPVLEAAVWAYLQELAKRRNWSKK